MSSLSARQQALLSLSRARVRARAHDLSFSLLFALSSTFLSLSIPRFVLLIASVQLCRTRTIVSPRVLGSPVTCVAFQWLLTSSTDKFSSSRLSIVRFRCLLRKKTPRWPFVRTAFFYIFRISSRSVAYEREKRPQRRIYIIDMKCRNARAQSQRFHKSREPLYHFISMVNTMLPISYTCV